VSSDSCIVFDVDDTLYLERDYVRSGFRAVGERVRERLGVAGFDEVAWALFERGQRKTIFDRALEELGFENEDANLIGELVRVYRDHRPTIALLPDARACLERLVGRFRLGVVTDGPEESQRAKVEALGLARFIPHVIVTGDLGPCMGKPAPAPFLRIEQATGCRGARCAYIADNPVKDFIAPRALGWRTVRIRRPAGLHARAPGAADIDLATLDGLESALGW
jgi:putative hydrolase of the HAD superfamily